MAPPDRRSPRIPAQLFLMPPELNSTQALLILLINDPLRVDYIELVLNPLTVPHVSTCITLQMEEPDVEYPVIGPHCKVLFWLTVPPSRRGSGHDGPEPSQPPIGS